jgi:urease accessory protein
MSAAPDLPPARALRRAPLGSTPYDVVVLRHDERLLRRRRLVTAHDEGFLVDLPTTSGLDQGDAFELEDGRLIEVIAAEELLLEVRGPDLPRLAWHIGNRHAPCQIEADRLLIQRDHVLQDMLRRLGAEVREASEPFLPEGGAYGLGRTMGHDHYNSDLGQLSSHVPGHGG